MLLGSVHILDMTPGFRSRIGLITAGLINIQSRDFPSCSASACLVLEIRAVLALYAGGEVSLSHR